MRYYHGTSTKLKINNKLQPACITHCLRENFRANDLDRVFITNSIVSAKKYAKKACKKFGGDPIVFEVNPIGLVMHTINNEFICDSAIIIDIINEGAT